MRASERSVLRKSASVSDGPLFTIFTPTYNRCHTLYRAFNSLCAQTLRNFEWLVVDDGSTDDTGQLVSTWAKRADFPIRYIRQDHAGKHIAHNRALAEARGVFFAPLDSDDALVPDALQKLFHCWNSIPEQERHLFYSVDGLCCDQHGNIVGDRYPRDPFDSDLREMKYVYRLAGEKWGVGLTDILRRFPFPDLPGIGYIPEGIVWMDIAKRFKSRAINEVVRVYYVDEAELGVTTARKGNLDAHAAGRWRYYIWVLNNDLEYSFRAPLQFIKVAALLPALGWFSGQKLNETMTALKYRQARLLVTAMLPFSALLYVVDKVKRSKTT
jgi:glycosyltransferase involved in cell wall biosynthesis